MQQSTLSGEVLQDPWDDEELLRELYHGEGLSLRSIGERLGCGYTKIHRRMFEFGIERRGESFGPERQEHATFSTRADGYEYWSMKTSSVLVHRLLAVAEYGFDEVCDGIIHHNTPIPWLNTPDNIEVLESHSEHAKLHARKSERGGGQGTLPNPVEG